MARLVAVQQAIRGPAPVHGSRHHVASPDPGRPSSRRPGVYPTGRSSDMDSEGLLLLTGDGTAAGTGSPTPKFKTPKTYLVQVEGDSRMGLASKPCDCGVRLEDGPPPCAGRARRRSCPLAPRSAGAFRKTVSDCWLELTIRGGRNRQVRRTAAAVGLPTLRWCAESIGGWTVEEIAQGMERRVGRRA